MADVCRCSPSASLLHRLSLADQACSHMQEHLGDRSRGALLHDSLVWRLCMQTLEYIPAMRTQGSPETMRSLSAHIGEQGVAETGSMAVVRLMGAVANAHRAVFRAPGHSSSLRH